MGLHDLQSNPTKNIEGHVTEREKKIMVSRIMIERAHSMGQALEWRGKVDN